jgi:DNA polymerase
MWAQMDHATARALLEWQMELGATEAIGEAPIDRYALNDATLQSAAAAQVKAPSVAASMVAQPSPAPSANPAQAQARAVQDAHRAAQSAQTLPALAAAMAAYPHCDLRRGARNCVFADGNPKARVMVIGEAPGRDEDMQGRPFVGRAGQFLDRMFAAIGLGRATPDAAKALYITNILPWRPPENRRPTAEECAMLLPFVLRHVELAAPDILVLMGNTPCGALLGAQGITRLRGTWYEVLNRPALPMFHPAYLLRTPEAKRDAWADLLSLQARLRSLP